MYNIRYYKSTYDNFISRNQVYEHFTSYKVGSFHLLYKKKNPIDGQILYYKYVFRIKVASVFMLTWCTLAVNLIKLEL